MKKIMKTAIFMVALCGMFVLSGFALSDIPVQFNGQAMSFEIAVPQNIDGRVMVPLRGLMENIGADVSFDSDSGLITIAYQDKTITLKAGQSEMTVTTAGQSETKVVEPVPFIDPNTNSTYVGARFVSEALGFGVGWDSSCDTVVILDIDKLFDIDEDFTVYNKMLSDQWAYYADSPLKMSGTMNMDMAVQDESLPVSLSLAMDLNALYAAGNMDMTLNVTPDLSAILAMAKEEGADAETLAVLESFKKITMDVKFDMENSTEYIRSDIFNQNPVPLGDTGVITGDTWLKIDLDEMQNMPGMEMYGTFDYSQWMLGAKQENMALSDTLKLLYTSIGYTTDSYQNIQSTIAVLKEMVGDHAFTVSQSSGNGETIKTYTKKFGTADMSKILLAAGKDITETEDLSLAEITELLNAFKGEYTITFKNDVFYYSTYSFKVNLSDDESELNFVMDIDGVSSLKGKSTGNISMDIVDILTMNIDYEIITETTDETPDTTEPENVIDMTQLMVS